MAKITSIQHTEAFYCECKPGDNLPDGTSAPGHISDLRLTFTFGYDSAEGPVPKSLNCFTSYKKHLAECYRDLGDYKPTAAREDDKNTILSLTKLEFKSDFDHYAEHLIKHMQGQETAHLNPSLIPPFNTGHGIIFTNNNDRFGKPFHCFPQHNPGGGKSVDLTGRQLMDFVQVMAFLQQGKNVRHMKVTVLRSQIHAVAEIYLKYRKEPWFRQIVAQVDRKAFKALLIDLAPILEEMSEAEVQQKKATALATHVPKVKHTIDPDDEIPIDLFG